MARRLRGGQTRPVGGQWGCRQWRRRGRRPPPRHWAQRVVPLGRQGPREPSTEPDHVQQSPTRWSEPAGPRAGRPHEGRRQRQQLSLLVVVLLLRRPSWPILVVGPEVPPAVIILFMLHRWRRGCLLPESSREFPVDVLAELPLPRLLVCLSVGLSDLLLGDFIAAHELEFGVDLHLGAAPLHRRAEILVVIHANTLRQQLNALHTSQRVL
mmetsp:Transcript_24859/g.61451  ORF Transcript_24859/g.61451 Transcript_24859/m.61451 type:complete len:211 (-) Transcript_24859:700-1332(-)